MEQVTSFQKAARMVSSRPSSTCHMRLRRCPRACFCSPVKLREIRTAFTGCSSPNCPYPASPSPRSRQEADVFQLRTQLAWAAAICGFSSWQQEPTQTTTGSQTKSTTVRPLSQTISAMHPSVSLRLAVSRVEGNRLLPFTTCSARGQPTLHNSVPVLVTPQGATRFASEPKHSEAPHL